MSVTWVTPARVAADPRRDRRGDAVQVLDVIAERADNARGPRRPEALATSGRSRRRGAMTTTTASAA
jgi:hypothetical protein